MSIGPKKQTIFFGLLGPLLIQLDQKQKLKNLIELINLPQDFPVAQGQRSSTFAKS
jgi:hypothetical protein